MPIDPVLKAIVCCPKCKGALTLEARDAAFVCIACKLRYPVQDGVPNFLIHEAEAMSQPEESTL